MDVTPPGLKHSGKLAGNRFLLLLIVLLAMIVVDLQTASAGAGTLLQTTLISLVLVAAISCLQFKRGRVLTTQWFGLFTLLTGWIPLFLTNPILNLGVAAFRIVFLLTVTGALIYQVAISKSVSLQVIIGAVDGYLLLGVVGAVAFTIAESLIPGSIQSAAPTGLQSDFLYFSFITMLTVGYGEILPVSPTAQTIAVFLAVCGQLYIAILVAILVGKFLSANQSGGTAR